MNNIFISTACLKGDKNYDRVINEFIDNDIKNIELTGVHPFLKIDEVESCLDVSALTGKNLKELKEKLQERFYGKNE